MRGNKIRSKCLPVVLLTACFLAVPAAQALTPRQICAAWKTKEITNVTFGGTVGIGGTGSTDLWAVGLYDYSPSFPIILHWDGSAWTQGNQDSGGGDGIAVAALTTTDAWMVGQNGIDPLIKHWDGTIWSTYPLAPIGLSSRFGAVAAISSTDVWAAGNWSDSSALHPLAMHWDGVTWSQFTVPDGPDGGKANNLTGLAAIASDDVWAVGHYDRSGETKPLIEHWDGVQWSLSDAPHLRGNNNLLYGVAASSATDVWAVGQQGDTSLTLRTLVEHWDGTSWSVSPTPDAPGRLDLLGGVAAVSPTDVSVVGSYVPGSSALPLAEHWDGSHWTRIPMPVGNGVSGGLAGLYMVSPTEIWGAGVYDSNTGLTTPLIGRNPGCR